MPSSSFSRSEDGTTGKANDERTPLLATISPVPTNQTVEEAIAEVDGVHNEDEDAPLPMLQIFFLCYTRLVDPIAFFSIFPYINSMIEKTGGIKVEDVGFYSGTIESLFSLTQMCVMIFWGKAADRYGRKPCLVISLFGTALTTALFGMSRTLWQMVLFRCLAGVFAGTLVTVRAMITENSTKKTQARAFSYFAFANNLGIFFGPLIGGALERPATKYSSIFGRIQFFHDYPYALPGFATSIIGLSAGVLSWIFVRETLHLSHSKRSSNHPSMSTWELLNYPGVARVIIIYQYVLLLAFAYTAVNPVFLYTPVNRGGVGFQPELIAAAIGVNGVSQAIWLLFAFPPLQHRIGTIGVMKFCAYAWPLFFLANPFCNLFLRHGLKAVFWTVGPINCVIGSGVAMAFTANQLSLNDIAPTHETLGTLNAIALAISSGLRAVIPALATAIFATGVKYRILNGQLFWIIAVVFAVGLYPIVLLLPKKAHGKLEEDDNGEA